MNFGIHIGAHGWAARRDAQAVEVRRRQGLRLVLRLRPFPGVAPRGGDMDCYEAIAIADRRRDGHREDPAGQRRLLRRVPEPRACSPSRSPRSTICPTAASIAGSAPAGTTSRPRPSGTRSPTIGPREDMLEEYAQILRLLLDPEQKRANFQGKHFQVPTRPTIPSRSSPASRSGSAGAARSARSAPRQSTPTAGTAPTSVRTSGSTRAQVLDRWCETEGRDPKTIMRTREPRLLPRGRREGHRARRRAVSTATSAAARRAPSAPATSAAR